MADRLLATTEAARLAELEATIERGLQTFLEVGQALMEIRESRLYRAEFDTFEHYCRERRTTGCATSGVGAAAVPTRSSGRPCPGRWGSGRRKPGPATPAGASRCRATAATCFGQRQHEEREAREREEQRRREELGEERYRELQEQAAREKRQQRTRALVVGSLRTFATSEGILEWLHAEFHGLRGLDPADCTPGQLQALRAGINEAEAVLAEIRSWSNGDNGKGAG